MVDPLKLAEEIEQADDPDCAETPFLLFERHRKLVAAALRLAEAVSVCHYGCTDLGCDLGETTFIKLAAYRAAREGR